MWDRCMHVSARERKPLLPSFACMWGQPIRERNVAQQAIQPTDQEILVESSSGAALHVEERVLTVGPTLVEAC